METSWTRNSYRRADLILQSSIVPSCNFNEILSDPTQLLDNPRPHFRQALIYYEAGLFRLEHLRVLLHLQYLKNDTDPVETGALHLFSAWLNLLVNQKLMEALDVGDKWADNRSG